MSRFYYNHHENVDLSENDCLYPSQCGSHFNNIIFSSFGATLIEYYEPLFGLTNFNPSSVVKLIVSFNVFEDLF